MSEESTGNAQPETPDIEGTLPAWRQAVQFVAGLAVLLALGLSWSLALPLWNRFTILRDKDNYNPEVFIVLDAEYEQGLHKMPDAYWLVGTVSLRKERLVPMWRGLPPPRSAAELLQRFPKGTRVPVLYNPRATEMMVQGETLRVIEADRDFWDEEASVRWRLGLYVFVPASIAIAVYLSIRLNNHRHLRLP